MSPDYITASAYNWNINKRLAYKLVWIPETTGGSQPPSWCTGFNTNDCKVFGEFILDYIVLTQVSLTFCYRYILASYINTKILILIFSSLPRSLLDRLYSLPDISALWRYNIIAPCMGLCTKVAK